MSNHSRFWRGSLFVAWLAGAAVLAGETRKVPQTTGGAQVPLQSVGAPQGAALYRTYCAPCHGVTGRGDGPVAESLRRRPPNLMELAKRASGVYPRELVFRIIDGRQRVPGHGGPEMPVWGDAFSSSIDVRDAKTLAARIQVLVDYLEAMQSRDIQ